MKRQPGDLAARDLPGIAAALRDDANREPGKRRMLGNSPVALRLAADLLDAIAHGRNPSTVIDWRKHAMPQAKCIEVIIGAAAELEPQSSHAATWRKARELAAQRLGCDIRNVQRHWKAWLREHGRAEDDLIPMTRLPQLPKKRTTRIR